MMYKSDESLGVEYKTHLVPLIELLFFMKLPTNLHSSW